MSKTTHFPLDYKVPSKFFEGYSDAFKQHQIKHMIEIIEMRINQETKQTIKVPWPEKDEDLSKLQEMYDNALAKYTH